MNLLFNSHEILMDDLINISIDIPLDENGMLGRECNECKRYFKLKPGTGLQTTYCHCPYCDYEGESDTFWTEAQIKYAESMAMNQAFKMVIKPSMDQLFKSFKDLERRSKNSLLQFKVKVSGKEISFPVKYYTEQDIETTIECNNCGLIFSVYGVFARCPDCSELNAFLIYKKSLEIIQKQYEISQKPEIPTVLKDQTLVSVLNSAISVFDSLGKELRKRKPDKYPLKPKNLFQNLRVLNTSIGEIISNQLSNYSRLDLMFQVRHIYEHNMGVIDEDFIKALPEYSDYVGRKYKISENDVKDFLQSMFDLGKIIEEYHNN